MVYSGNSSGLYNFRNHRKQSCIWVGEWFQSFRNSTKCVRVCVCVVYMCVVCVCVCSIRTCVPCVACALYCSVYVV